MVVVSPAAAKGKEKRTNVRRGFCRKHGIQMIIYTPTHALVISAFAILWCSFSKLSIFFMLHGLYGGFMSGGHTKKKSSELD